MIKYDIIVIRLFFSVSGLFAHLTSTSELSALCVLYSVFFLAALLCGVVIT